MTAHHAAPAGLPLWNRVAGRFLRLFNPVARRMISAGNRRYERAPDGPRSAVGQASNGPGRHARARRLRPMTEASDVVEL